MLSISLELGKDKLSQCESCESQIPIVKKEEVCLTPTPPIETLSINDYMKADLRVDTIYEFINVLCNAEHNATTNSENVWLTLKRFEHFNTYVTSENPYYNDRSRFLYVLQMIIDDCKEDNHFSINILENILNKFNLNDVTMIAIYISDYQKSKKYDQVPVFINITKKIGSKFSLNVLEETFDPLNYLKLMVAIWLCISKNTRYHWPQDEFIDYNVALRLNANRRK